MASANPKGGKSKGKGKPHVAGTFADVQHKGAPHKLAPTDDAEFLAILKARDRPKLLHFSATYFYSPELWLSVWHKVLAKSDFATIKSLRLFVQYNTIHMCSSGAYFLPEGVKVSLPKDTITQSVRGTCTYESAPKIVPPGPFDTEWHVVQEDCLMAAVSLSEKGLNPAVLVLASSNNPGGGYMNGAGAQEENLCRRSTLWQCLMDPFSVDMERKWSYPIPQFGGIYSPKVLVFRGSEKEGYPFLAAPIKLGFINSAAYHEPPVERGKGVEWRLSGRIIGDYLKKMRAIFSIALERGHDSIVLSAYGCGAYRNPPRHMAELFYEVLMDPLFRNSFKVVCFAILDDHNAHKGHNPEGNFKPFKDTFEKMK